MKRARPETNRALKWSAAASDDFTDILARLDRQSIAGSIAFELAMHDSVASLRRFPKVGRIPLEYAWSGGGELREILVGDNRVGYLADARAVEVIYVIHCRQHFPPLNR